MKKPILASLAIVTALVAVSAMVVFNPSPYVPGGKTSKAFYQQSARYPVITEDFAAVDPERPVEGNGDFEGLDYRLFQGKIWRPDVSEPGSFPLVVYSHGFMSNYDEATYLGEFLAARGYVMVAVSYPLTNLFAPGGPRVKDVIHQPADVSFLIDQLLERSAKRSDPLYGMIDEEKIAVAGLSLGGMTTSLVAYHVNLRDERIRLAASIAGPTEIFSPSFFTHAKIPLLYIAGDVDAMVHYENHALPLPEKKPGTVVVTIKGGSHTGFTDFSAKGMRWMDNPDALGCYGLEYFMPDGNENVLAELGGEKEGMVFRKDYRMPCDVQPLPKAISPGKQQMYTALAVYSFFESHFAGGKQAKAAGDFLRQVLPAENEPVSVVF